MSRKIGVFVLLLAGVMAWPVLGQTIYYGNDYSKLAYQPPSSPLANAFRMPGPRMPGFNLTSLMPRVNFPTYSPRPLLGFFQLPKTTFVPGAQLPKK